MSTVGFQRNNNQHILQSAMNSPSSNPKMEKQISSIVEESSRSTTDSLPQQRPYNNELGMPLSNSTFLSPYPSPLTYNNPYLSSPSSSGEMRSRDELKRQVTSAYCPMQSSDCYNYYSPRINPNTGPMPSPAAGVAPSHVYSSYPSPYQSDAPPGYLNVNRSAEYHHHQQQQLLCQASPSSGPQLYPTPLMHPSAAHNSRAYDTYPTGGHHDFLSSYSSHHGHNGDVAYTPQALYESTLPLPVAPSNPFMCSYPPAPGNTAIPSNSASLLHSNHPPKEGINSSSHNSSRTMERKKQFDNLIPHPPTSRTTCNPSPSGGLNGRTKAAGNICSPPYASSSPHSVYQPGFVTLAEADTSNMTTTHHSGMSAGSDNSSAQKWDGQETKASPESRAKQADRRKRNRESAQRCRARKNATLETLGKKREKMHQKLERKLRILLACIEKNNLMCEALCCFPVAPFASQNNELLQKVTVNIQESLHLSEFQDTKELLVDALKHLETTAHHRNSGSMCESSVTAGLSNMDCKSLPPSSHSASTVGPMDATAEHYKAYSSANVHGFRCDGLASLLNC